MMASKPLNLTLLDLFYSTGCKSSCAFPIASCALLMKSEDMKDEWEEADAKQQQQVEEHEHDERSSCTGW